MITVRSSEIHSPIRVGSLTNTAHWCLANRIYYFAGNAHIFDLHDLQVGANADTLYNRCALWHHKRGWCSPLIEPVFDGLGVR